MALGIVILQGPEGVLLLMSKVPLWGSVGKTSALLHERASERLQEFKGDLNHLRCFDFPQRVSEVVLQKSIPT